jgi:hypothetical protein
LDIAKALQYCLQSCSVSLYVRARIASSDFGISAFETLFEIP